MESHRHAWDFVAPHYSGGSALPAWGTKGELQDEEVIHNIKNTTILEIGSGSGDSLIYLLKNGAKHITGIDFSPTQIKIAENRIRLAFKNSPDYTGKITLLLRPMDEPLPTGLFDHILAIYSIGWSERPEKLFRNVYDKLKPGGYFYFSWDHYLARIVEQTEQGITIVKSYHEPMPLVRENWKGSGSLIETHQLRPSDWFAMLTDAGFIVDGFWEPKPDKKRSQPKIYSATYSPLVSEFIPTCVVFRAKKPFPH